MILDKDGKLWVLEANSLPGMTPNSFVPKEAAAVGMSYDAALRGDRAALLRREEERVNCMQPMTIPEIVSAVDGTWLNPREGAAPVTAVCTDSRKIAPGCLFLPWVGERFDGHDLHRHAALSAGAAGCLCSPGAGGAAARQVLYPGGRTPALALRCPGRPPTGAGIDIPFVQVTGSVGKTTTKEMLAPALCGDSFRVLKTPENFNNRHRHPPDAAGPGAGAPGGGDRDGHEPLRGDPLFGGAWCGRTIAVISNIGDAHIEHLGSTRQGILQAKCEIFENLQPGGAGGSVTGTTPC